MQSNPPPVPPSFSYPPIDSGPTGPHTYPFPPYGAPYYMYPPQARQEYGSFWRRFFASWIDSIIQALVAIPVGLLVFAYSATDSLSDMNGVSSANTAFSVAAALMGLVFVIGFNAFGGTPGKRALGMRVTDKDGNNPGLASAILRSCFPIMSLLLSGVWIISNGGFQEGDEIDTLLASTVITSGLTLLINAIWFIGCLLVISDQHKQALHDKIAGTYVIRT